MKKWLANRSAAMKVRVLMPRESGMKMWLLASVCPADQLNRDGSPAVDGTRQRMESLLKVRLEMAQDRSAVM